jgi:uncharacterized protein YdeI (YjbR/CyaY-like superfamily)
MRISEWDDLERAGITVPLELRRALDEDPEAKAAFFAAEYEERLRHAAQVADGTNGPDRQARAHQAAQAVRVQARH